MNFQENKNVFSESLYAMFPHLQVLNEEESKKQELQYEENERKEKENKKQKHYESSGIKDRYFECRINQFDAYTDELKHHFEIVKKFINDVNSGYSKTLWLCGNHGNGKTLLASYIVRECWGNFCKTYNIEDDLKIADSFSCKENRRQVFERYAGYSVLVIDEVASYPSDNERKYLFHILNDRYEKNLSTVIVTNLSNSELKKYLGNALVDRFMTNCISLNFTGESYRKKERMKSE